MVATRKALRPIVLVAFGVGLLWLATGHGATEEKENDSSHEKIQQLLHQRLEIAQALVESQEALYRNAKAGLDDLQRARMELLRIKLELAESSQERIAVYQEMIQNAKRTLGLAKAKLHAVRGTKVEILESQSQILKIKIALEREKVGITQ